MNVSRPEGLFNPYPETLCVTCKSRLQMACLGSMQESRGKVRMEVFFGCMSRLAHSRVFLLSPLSHVKTRLLYKRLLCILWTSYLLSRFDSNWGQIDELLFWGCRQTTQFSCGFVGIFPHNMCVLFLSFLATREFENLSAHIFGLVFSRSKTLLFQMLSLNNKE